MALPSWVPPQLSKLVKEPPGGPAWLHEVKFDGYRMHARIDSENRFGLHRRIWTAIQTSREMGVEVFRLFTHMNDT
jgi:hypothetical protein